MRKAVSVSILRRTLTKNHPKIPGRLAALQRIDLNAHNLAFRSVVLLLREVENGLCENNLIKIAPALQKHESKVLSLKLDRTRPRFPYNYSVA